MNNNIRYLAHIILLFAILVLSGHLWAATCAQTFPSGLASTSNTGSITINYGANIYNVPNNQLVTKNLNSSSNACNASACSKTDTVAQQAANFTNFPGGSSVYVNYQETRNFASSTNFSSLGSNTLSVLNFAPGDYTINGNVQIGSETRLNVSANGTVRIFVNGNLDIGADAQINMGTDGGSSRFVYFYTRGYFTMHTGADAKAVVYAKGDVTLNNNITLTGAITSEANMVMQFGAALTYNATYVTNTNFGSSCTLGTSLNSFLIDVGGGSASTCSPKSITITARDGSNNKLTGYTGTISLSTSTNRGTWAKTGTSSNANGTLTPGSDNGAATYTFTAADAGDIVLTLDNQRAQALTITVTDSSAGKSNTSATLTFSHNAFVIAATDILGDDVVAGRDHTFTATMMRRDPTTGNCGAATAYNVSNLRMWLTRNGNDPGGAAPTVNSVSLPNSQPGSNNINLSFTNGIALFSLRTTDVGKYAINLADTSNSFASSTVTGSSATLVARPFGIRIGVTNNPRATDAMGPAFRAAGQIFTVTVTAVAWQALDDANNDGIPDNHNDTLPGNNVDLTNNNPLVSFGRENPAEGISVSADLFAPSPGINPGLSGSINFPTFSAGTASTPNISFGDVGIIEIAARITDNDYMGSTGTAKIIGKSGHVGRFYPDHFRLTNLSATPSCSSLLPYSYLSEDFSLGVTMTPSNAAGAAVQNYTGSFNKFNTSAVQSMLFAVDQLSAVNLSTRLTSAGGIYNWSAAGVLTATPNVRINRAANPDGPFAQVRFGFKPVDNDGVTVRTSELNLDIDNNGTADAVRFGETAMGLRYGRLRLDDSYGPETANLPVIFRTEFWNGTEWRQNRDDSCTRIAANRIRYPGGTINVVANRSTAIGSGTTSGVYANLNASGVNFSAGDAGQYFTAPGAGNVGSLTVQVDLTDYPWLRFDWNGDGNYNDTSLPSARFTFGNYRGHDRVLYWIEPVAF